jgi:hypothetical protein
MVRSKKAISLFLVAAACGGSIDNESPDASAGPQGVAGDLGGGQPYGGGGPVAGGDGLGGTRNYGGSAGDRGGSAGSIYVGGGGAGGYGGYGGSAGASGFVGAGGYGGFGGFGGYGGYAGSAGSAGSAGHAGDARGGGGGTVAADAGPIACFGLSAPRDGCGLDTFCDFSGPSCNGGPAIESFGFCQPRPQLCPLDDCPGVCGCDGRFYCNSCLAHVAGTDDSTYRSCFGFQ